MLSLATVNGRAIEQSPLEQHKRSQSLPNDDELVFAPTNNQLKEISEMLKSRARHPILQMRVDARINSMQTSPTRSQPKQVIRSITFFNSKQALKEKAEDLQAQQSVFKLSTSVERMTTFQPNMTLQPSDANNSMSLVYKRDASSKQILDNSLVIPDSTTNRFQHSTVQNSTLSSALNQTHKRQTSQLFKTPQRSIRLSKNNSPQRTMKIKQSCLYHASKVTNETMQHMRTYKQEMRNYLAQSMAPGQFRVEQNSQISKDQSSPDYMTGNENLTQMHQQMINQDSSIINIQPTALFNEANAKYDGLADDTFNGDNDGKDPQYLTMDDRKPTGQISSELQDQKGKESHLRKSQGELSGADVSHGFRLDLSRVSQKQLVQRQASVEGDTNQKHQKEVQQFQDSQKQLRAQSSLELEMLKDIKEIAPELGDERLRFVSVDKNKSLVKKKQYADGRYIEPNMRAQGKHKTLQMNTSSQIGLIPNEQSQQLDLAKGQNKDYLVTEVETGVKPLSSENKAFEDYLQQISNRVLTSDTRNAELDHDKTGPYQPVNVEMIQTLPVSEEDETNSQEGEFDMQENTSQVSSEGDSVLQAIENTVQSILSTGHNDFVQQPQQTASSNVDVINEMLTSRKKFLRTGTSQKGGNTIRAFNTGTFKLKNLQTLEVVPVYQSTANRLISPTNLSPKTGKGPLNKYQSLKSPNMTSIKTNIGLNKVGNMRYSSVNNVHFDNEVQERLSSSVLELEDQSGLQIVQVNLGIKPERVTMKSLNKTTSKNREHGSSESINQPLNRNSNMSHSSKQPARKSPTVRPSQQQVIQIGSDSRFKKVDPKMASLATKSQGSSNRATGNLGVSGNVLSNKGTAEVIPQDLQVVMDSSDINFKRKKQPFGTGVRSYHAQYSVQQNSAEPVVRVDVNKLGNTLRAAENGHLFPKIFQDGVDTADKNKGQATFDQSFQKGINDPPDSTGTKYFMPTGGSMTANEIHHSGEGKIVSDERKKEETARQNSTSQEFMNATFSKDSKQREKILRRDSSQEVDYDENTVTVLPPVQQELAIDNREYLQILESPKLPHQKKNLSQFNITNQSTYHKHLQTNQSSSLQIIRGTQELQSNQASSIEQIESMKNMTQIKVEIENTTIGKDRLQKKTEKKRHLDKKIASSMEKSGSLKKFIRRKNKEADQKSRSPIVQQHQSTLHQISTRETKNNNVYATLQASPRSPRKLNTIKAKKNNNDLQKDSILVNKTQKDKNDYHQYDVRQSEISLINQSVDPSDGKHPNGSTRVKSLLSDIARQHFEYTNNFSQLQVDPYIQAQNPRSVLSQDMVAIENDEEQYSPKYKHMPISLYKKSKYYSMNHTKLEQGIIMEKELQKQLQNIAGDIGRPIGNSTATGLFGSNKHETAKKGSSKRGNEDGANSVFKRESGYVRNLRWTRDSKKILGQSYNASRADSVNNLHLNDQDKRSNVLGRGSVMNRSLVLQDSSNLINGSSILEVGKLPALVEVSHPQNELNVSRILQRSSVMAANHEHLSQASLSSSIVREQQVSRANDGYSGLSILKTVHTQHHWDGSQNNEQRLSKASNTRAKFMKIKEEMRASQLK